MSANQRPAPNRLIDKVDKALGLVDKVLMEFEARTMALLSKKSAYVPAHDEDYYTMSNEDHYTLFVICIAKILGQTLIYLRRDDGVRGADNSSLLQEVSVCSRPFLSTKSSPQC